MPTRCKVDAELLAIPLISEQDTEPLGKDDPSGLYSTIHTGLRSIGTGDR